MFAWWSLAALAQPRAVIHRVNPDYPDRELRCTASLAVAADGTVAVERISGCKAYRELLSAALVRWRYAPAPQATVEEVELRHSPDALPGIRIWNAPRWSSPEEEAVGRLCIAHVWGGGSDRADSIEVINCEGPAKETLIDTIVSWRFDVTEHPWERFYTAHQEEVQKRILPAYPPRSPEEATCVILAGVVGGQPTIEDVLLCGEPFASAAAQAVKGWRWSKDSPPFTSAVTIHFRKN